MPTYKHVTSAGLIELKVKRVLYWSGARVPLAGLNPCSQELSLSLTGTAYMNTQQCEKDSTIWFYADVFKDEPVAYIHHFIQHEF